MKTLKGKPIDGDLQTLYKYYFSPGGGYKEAADLAEANGMLNALEVLIQNQRSDIDVLVSKIMRYTVGEKLNYSTRRFPDGLIHRYELLPRMTRQHDWAEEIIERHATTGDYKINVEFKMLGAKAIDDKPEYFCNEVDFHLLMMRGNHQVFLPKQVPAHLVDAKFYDACFRAAMALHMAINMTWEKFRGFDTPFRKDVVIHHNLPNYPPIAALQKPTKYE